jgi:hypothetical protein
VLTGTGSCPTEERVAAGRRRSAARIATVAGAHAPPPRRPSQSSPSAPPPPAAAADALASWARRWGGAGSRLRTWTDAYICPWRAASSQILDRHLHLPCPAAPARRFVRVGEARDVTRPRCTRAGGARAGAAWRAKGPWGIPPPPTRRRDCGARRSERMRWKEAQEGQDGEDRRGQARAGEGRRGQARAGEGRRGQARTGERDRTAWTAAEAA